MQNNHNVKDTLKSQEVVSEEKHRKKKKKKKTNKNNKNPKPKTWKIKYLNIRNVKINILFGEGRWNKENILFIFKRLLIKNKSLK